MIRRGRTWRPGLPVRKRSINISSAQAGLRLYKTVCRL
jgi:hypothetical protein